jgi:hypothetical protein
MNATRLARPQIYTPMSQDELLRLRLYHDRVDELQRSSSFSGGSETVRMFSSHDGVESTGRSDFDREGFLAVARLVASSTTTSRRLDSSASSSY